MRLLVKWLHVGEKAHSDGEYRPSVRISNYIEGVLTHTMLKFACGVCNASRTMGGFILSEFHNILCSFLFFFFVDNKRCCLELHGCLYVRTRTRLSYKGHLKNKNQKNPPAIQVENLSNL